MDLKKIYGSVVRRERVAKGLSIEALAHEAGLSYSYFDSMELGKRNPSLRVIFAVANALDVEADQMVREVAQQLAAQPDEKASARR